MASPIIPQIQQVNENGLPAVGWQLYVFEVGTSTPKSTYSDSLLTVLNAHPIVLDALGMASVYYSGSARLLMLDEQEFTRWEEPRVNSADAVYLTIKDGVTPPSAVVGEAYIYVDSADGDLKVKFGDGTIKTIATDT
jgi:hypothetical protein